MKRSLPTMAVLIATSSVAADCDCTIYPFRPNPPCYSQCVAQLAAKNNPDLSAIKGMDSDAAAAIKRISERPDKSSIEYSNIHGKGDLESIAAKGPYETTKDKYETAKGHYETAKGQYEAAKGQYETTKEKYETAKDKYEAAKDRYETAKDKYETKRDK